MKTPLVAIIDYGMGNLFSIVQACNKVYLDTLVVSSTDVIGSADGLILPGVGAFGDAIETLKKLSLFDKIKSFVASGKPLMGICLGMQLLMSESFEFGHHKGLDVVKGSVIRFEKPADNGGNILKVPHVGWNKIDVVLNGRLWEGTMLTGIANGDFMYFSHSYHVVPDSEVVIVSTTKYGDKQFCSSLQYGNVFGCQYHPERSGRQGLKIYENFAQLLKK